MNIYCKTSSPPNFLSDSQSTDVAKGNYFCRMLVTLKSQKSAKYVIRVTFSWPRKSDPRSNVLDCFKQVITAVSQEWAKNILWNQKVMNVHTYVKCLWMYSPFCWFLGPYSHHHLTKIIAICSVGWLGMFTGKTQRRRCIEISGSWLFLSLALSDKLFKSFSCHRLIDSAVESANFIQL